MPRRTPVCRAATCAAAVLALALVVAAATAAAASATVLTTPALPLLDVPFYARPNDLGSVRTLFLSLKSDCSSKLKDTPPCTVGAAQPGSSFANGTCVFNVTSAELKVNLLVASVSVPLLYWCSDAGARSTLQMNVVGTTPSYFLSLQNTELTFNEATPVGSRIGLFADPTCLLLIPGTVVFSLNDSRGGAVNYAGGLVYVCAAVPTVSGEMTAMALRRTLGGVLPYTVSPSGAVRHRTVSLGSSSSGLARYYLSSYEYCNDTNPTVQMSVGSSLPFVVDYPPGIYYFCGADSTGNTGFVPSTNRFTVIEYDVQPHTMYAGLATQATYAAPKRASRGSGVSSSASFSSAALEAALSRSKSCDDGSLVQGWSATPTWTVPAAGVHYACVRNAGDASTAGYTNAVSVTVAPTVTFAPSLAVRGMPLSVTVRHADAGTARFGVRLTTDGACDTAGAHVGDVTAPGTATASMTVPALSGEAVWYCVSNPVAGNANATATDGSVVYYLLGTLPTRAFRVGHGALRTDTRLSLTLDAEVELPSGTVLTLTPPAPTASSGGGSMTFDVSGAGSVVAAVSFASDGEWQVSLEGSVPGGASFTGYMASLVVYAAAARVEAGTVVAGITAVVVASLLPPAAAVTVTSSGACGPSMDVVTSIKTGGDGLASLVVQYASAATLLVCAAYPTASAAAPASSSSSGGGARVEVLAVGRVRVTALRVYPGIAFTSETTTLRLAGMENVSLVGYTAMLTKGAAPCGVAGSPTVSLPVQSPSGLPGVPYAVVAAGVLEAGAVYSVCVKSSALVGVASAGNVSAAVPATFTTDPAAPVLGLPVAMTLSSAFTSPAGVSWFAVVGPTVDCSADLSGVHVYWSGRVDASSGLLAPFLAPARSDKVASARVCVASNASLVSSTLGFALGATFTVTTFTSLRRYAVRGTPNTLAAQPTLGTGELYLAACGDSGCDPAAVDATCVSAWPGYPSSSTTALDAPLGTYALCQRAALDLAVGTAGANTTVQVIQPYTMTTTTSALRTYVPFTVTIAGGPSSTDGAAQTYLVVVQPATAACGATASESQEFTLSAGSSQMTITEVSALQSIRFCVRASPADSFEVMTGTLNSYITPAAVIGDRATTLTSASPASVVTALLSPSKNCSGSVAGGGATALVNGKVTFTVAACGANAQLTSLAYCEAGNGNEFVYRGSVAPLRASACDGGASASISAATVAPGVAISTFGIEAPLVLTDPRLSTSADCGTLVDAAVTHLGYAPGLDEKAVFHVCATLAGSAGVVFTTASPTLVVRKWSVTPTAAVSRYNATLGAATATTLTANYAMPSSATYLSTALDCSVRVGEAAGLSGSGLRTTYGTTGVRGLVYVCTAAPLSGRTLAVARLLSVTPPAVVRVSPAVVRGAAYEATLVVDGVPPLYSMVPGVDSTYDHSGLYVSENRTVYVSGDACASALAGTSGATVSSSGAVSFATSGIDSGVSKVWLCAVTAAGPAVVLADVAVAPGDVYPTQYVSGVLSAPVFMPRWPKTSFYLRSSARGCARSAALPSFTTDAGGYGVVDLVGPDGAALQLGTYTLCGTAASASDGGARAATALATAVQEMVEVVSASYFDVLGTTFVVGVAGTMHLLQDLTTDALVPGLSTVRNCTAVSDAYGTWTTATATSVTVAATAVQSAGLYVCAVAPVNGTLVSLPGAWGGASRAVRFVSSAMGLPTGVWDTCTTYTVDTCVPPGASESSATSVLAVVYGDCCGGGGDVVGQASMASGTCRISLDSDKVAAYPVGATYRVCVWDTADASACTTVATTTVSTNCTRGGGGGRGGMSIGAVAGVVGSCVAAAAAVGGAVAWRCCRVFRVVEEWSSASSELETVAGASERSCAWSTWSAPLSSRSSVSSDERTESVFTPLPEVRLSGPDFGEHPVLRIAPHLCRSAASASA